MGKKKRVANCASFAHHRLPLTIRHSPFAGSLLTTHNFARRPRARDDGAAWPHQGARRDRHPAPRSVDTLTSPEFIALKRRIMALIHEEAVRAMG